MSDPAQQIELWTRYEKNRAYSAELADLAIVAHQLRANGASHIDVTHKSGHRLIAIWPLPVQDQP